MNSSKKITLTFKNTHTNTINVEKTTKFFTQSETFCSKPSSFSLNEKTIESSLIIQITEIDVLRSFCK